VPSALPNGPQGAGTALLTEVDEIATRALVDRATDDLREVARALAEQGVHGVESKVLVEPRVGRAIVDFARQHQADAIAMSTHGRGATRLLIGSIADKVLRGTHLPVLLRRPARVETERGWLSAASIDEQLSAIAGAKYRE
jgi:nucleotide-binding universal stress UspA family protein